MLIIISLLLILSVGFHSSVTGSCSYSGGFCRIWVFFFFRLCQHWNELCVWLWPLVLEAFPRMKFFCTSERQIKSLRRTKMLINFQQHFQRFYLLFCVGDWIWAAVMSCREAPGSVFIKFYSLWRGDGDQEGAKVWPRFFCSCPTASSIGWRNPVGDSTEDQVQVCSWFSALNVKKEIRCALQSIIMNSLPFFRDEFFDINFSVHL